MKPISKAATKKMLLATPALVAAAPAAVAVQAVALATKPINLAQGYRALKTQLLTPLFVENNYA
jgi:hypothetical protein